MLSIYYMLSSSLIKSFLNKVLITINLLLILNAISGKPKQVQWPYL